MKYSVSFLILGIVIVLVVVRNMQEVSPPTEDTVTTNDVISTSGLHWHATLEIFVLGEKMEVPTNIGLQNGHNPMHTHDPDGTIHLEYEGMVRTSDILLGKFFTLWGKPFNKNQLFENINGTGGTLTMTVNGTLNTEFESYQLQDGDVVVLRFE